MTAHAMQGDPEQCLQADMNDYLTKPLNVPALIKTLSRWLPVVAPVAQPPTPAATAAMASSHSDPALDWDELLERVGGEENFARDLLTNLLVALPAEAARLRLAAQTADADLLRRHAHALRGAVANISARQLYRLADRIEQAGARQDFETAGAAILGLDSTVEGLRQAVAFLHLG